MTDFTSTCPWEDVHASDLVIHCSDGRFARQHEEFARQWLSAEAADRIVVPGGAANYVFNELTSRSWSATRHGLELLVNGHGIRRIVCIAHHDCGYYCAHYPDDVPQAVRARQLADLRSVANTFSGWFAGIVVQLFYADVVDARVVFHPVTLAGAGGEA